MTGAGTSRLMSAALRRRRWLSPCQRQCWLLVADDALCGRSLFGVQGPCVLAPANANACCQGKERTRATPISAADTLGLALRQQGYLRVETVCTVGWQRGVAV